MSAPRPPSGAVLARLSALPNPGALVVDIERDGARISLLVTRRGQHVAAFRNKCPHAGYPLQRSDGRIIVQDGRYMICAAHCASFALEDGACAGGPCNGTGLERLAIVLRDGEILLA